MVVGEDQAHKPIARFVTLENVGKALPIVAAMLPVTGAVFRATSFAFSAHPIPQRLAIALPVTDLAMIGFSLFQPAVVFGITMAAVLFGYQRLIRSREPSYSGASRRTIALLIMTVLLLTLVASSFFFRGADQILRGVVSAGIVVWLTWLLLTARRRLAVSGLVGPIVLATVLLAMLSGVTTTTAGTQLATVHFSSTAGIQDGAFTILGEDGSGTWLLSCSPGSHPLRVRSDDVISVALLSLGPVPAAPTLAQMIERGSIQPAGFVQRCP